VTPLFAGGIELLKRRGAPLPAAVQKSGCDAVIRRQGASCLKHRQRCGGRDARELQDLPPRGWKQTGIGLIAAAGQEIFKRYSSSMIACGGSRFWYVCVMQRLFIFAAAALLALPVCAAEKIFNFSEYPLDRCPSNFSSIVAGPGKPGEWKVILDDVPPVLEPITPHAQSLAKRAVLAQVARDPQDNHFPMLISNEGTYGDFKLSTRFKITGGAMEQMAGIAFRFQNESNFYLVGGSAMGKSFRCFKVENGVVKPPFGPEMEISKGKWHEMTVQCEGTRILCTLDGKDAIKLIDNASAGGAGKVGFWTLSDSVAYFADAKITYTPRQALAQELVREALKNYPRVLGLKVFAVRDGGNPTVVGSKDENEIGQPGGVTEVEVIRSGTSYYSRDKESATVILPLRDRNGDPIAAVRVMMRTFPGQTEDNAILRAQPIIKQMRARVQSLQDLLE
jgi:hypothetical protein